MSDQQQSAAAVIDSDVVAADSLKTAYAAHAALVVEPPITPVPSFKEYKPLALRTKSPGLMRQVKVDGIVQLDGKGKPVVECYSEGNHIDLGHFAWGVKSEAGEAVGALKSAFFYGKTFDHVNFNEELGDQWWYVAIGINVVNDLLHNMPDLQIDVDSLIDGAITRSNHWQMTGMTHELQLRTLEREVNSLLRHVSCWSDNNATDFEVEFPARMTRDQGAPLSLRMAAAVTLLVNCCLASFSMEPEVSDYPGWYDSGFQTMWGKNVAKLRKRYANKFDSTEAIERTALAEERAILEA